MTYIGDGAHALQRPIMSLHLFGHSADCQNIMGDLTVDSEPGVGSESESTLATDSAAAA